jgi:hypothetical protein
VLCCVVLCCAVLCCVVLCCAVLCCVVLCHWVQTDRQFASSTNLTIKFALLFPFIVYCSTLVHDPRHNNSRQCSILQKIRFCFHKTSTKPVRYNSTKGTSGSHRTSHENVINNHTEVRMAARNLEFQNLN